MSENNKANLLIAVAWLIIAIEHILDKFIGLNKFLSIGLDSIALICFIAVIINCNKRTIK